MKPTVLLIDEAQLERKMNEWTLLQAGYEVITAETGEEGLRLAQERIPSAILLDPVLSSLNGHELLQKLKNDPRTVHIPVIILSSASQLRATRFKREGAAEYLDKQQVLADTSRLLADAVEGVLHPVL